MKQEKKLERYKYVVASLKLQVSKVQQQLNHYIKEVEEIQRDKLDEPLTCCKKVFDFRSEYNSHRETQKCRIERKDPHFKCKRCNRIFFDGAWSLSSLIRNYNKLYLKSSYRKHVEDGCGDSCDVCGETFGSYYSMKNHKCNKTHKDDPQPMTNMCDKEAYYKKKQKEQSPTPEPVSSPEPIKCEISEIESTDEEYESWQHNYRNYYVGNKSKRIIDEYDEPIGYLYQNRLIHSDDDLYEDFKDSLKEI